MFLLQLKLLFLRGYLSCGLSNKKSMGKWPIQTYFHVFIYFLLFINVCNSFLKISISKLSWRCINVLSTLKLNVHPGLFVNGKPACKPHQHLCIIDCVWAAALWLPASTLLEFHKRRTNPATSLKTISMTRNGKSFF